MAVVAQLVSAWDGSGRAQFVPAWAESAPSEALALVTAIDGGNASPTLSSITDAESETPVVSIDFRPGAIGGANGSGWRQALFAVENAEGKRPVFRLNRANMTNGTASPTADWRPYWTQDFQTWTRAPGNTLVGGSAGYIEFQFAEPLPAGRVYVASHPMGRQQEADAFAAWLLDTHAGVASPTISANPSGVFFTSPSETDELGRAIGANPMYAIKLSWGGGARKKLVQFAGIHAQGESASWFPFVACVKWMLEDASSEAADLRSKWDVYLYFNLTPNGIQGGHRRHNFRSSADPNRSFSISGTPSLAEIAAVQSAVIADVGETCDVFFSWHNYSSATNRFIPGRSHVPTAATMAFIDIGASIFGVTGMDYPESTTGIDRWWAEGRLAAKASFDAEVPQRGDTSVEEMESIGRAWARTLQATGAAGWFDPVTHELSGAAVSISTATGTLITSIQLAGSAASLSTAGGNLTAQITLSGAALAQAAATAALTAGAADLAGDAHATAEAIGTLTTQIRLSGAAVSQALAGADLTTESAGLSGSAQASATAMGLLGTGIPLVGEATATASAAGSLGVPILLSGAAAAVSSATGELTIALALQGHSLASALASGSLTTHIHLSGAALGRAAASGALAGTQIETPARRIYRVRYPARIMRVTT